MPPCLDSGWFGAPSQPCSLGRPRDVVVAVMLNAPCDRGFVSRTYIGLALSFKSCTFSFHLGFQVKAHLLDLRGKFKTGRNLLTTPLREVGSDCWGSCLRK